VSKPKVYRCRLCGNIEAIHDLIGCPGYEPPPDQPPRTLKDMKRAATDNQKEAP
jgi:hypothetical protein